MLKRNAMKKLVLSSSQLFNRFRIETSIVSNNITYITLGVDLIGGCNETT